MKVLYFVVAAQVAFAIDAGQYRILSLGKANSDLVAPEGEDSRRSPVLLPRHKFVWELEARDGGFTIKAPTTGLYISPPSIPTHPVMMTQIPHVWDFQSYLGEPNIFQLSPHGQPSHALAELQLPGPPYKVGLQPNVTTDDISQMWYFSGR
ncbi:hypothetical protein INT43_008994 [Umbelopsis isabellina]|uniref:Uncharacterized protein n=1 Tax=Mortierella isabellina TaxID=91625 RepID=A0A8H7PYD0_MORIS|nr:hypothetical protein INT43_008994 [Umbelopsis isabellina]